VTGSHYGYMDNDFLNYFFLIVIIIVNLLFFIYWLYHMRIEFLKILYVKNKAIYKLLTCNYYKDEDFEAKYMSKDRENVYEVNDNNEGL